VSENRVPMPTGVNRRWWLLLEALKSAPLREALAIAREAEAFLVGSNEAGMSQPTRMSEAQRTSDAIASAQNPAARYLH
jgi:hypothetical protein